MLLIRIIIRRSSALLSLSQFVQSKEQYAITFNSPFELPEKTHFGEIDDPNIFLACIDKATVNRATVGIYYPTHASFKKYDLFVRVWDKHGTVSFTNGYQLKEGKVMPTEESETTLCDESYVVRGQTAKKMTSLRNWKLPGTKDMDEFFGVSGAEWTPVKWRALKES